MNKSLLILGVVFALAISCSGKQKPDASKFAEFCQNVIKCDKDMKSLPPGMEEQCPQMMAGVEQKMPTAVPQIMECFDKTPCGEASLVNCMVTASQMQAQ